MIRVYREWFRYLHGSADRPRARVLLMAVLLLSCFSPSPIAATPAEALRATVKSLERLRYDGEITDAQRLQLAESYFQLRRFDDAAAEVQRIDPSAGAEALVLLRVRLAAQRKDWLEVRDLCNQAISRNPDHDAPYLFLGKALQQLGDAEGAEDAFATYGRLTQ
jgi:tetratricopeptide (TPR) repeat protein